MSGRTFELVAVAIGANLIRAGQQIQRRYAVVPAGLPDDALSIRMARWRMHVAAFVTHSDRLSFSQRRVIAAGIVTRPGYDVYMGLLKEAKILKTYARSGVLWAAPWTKVRFLVLLRRGEFTLPYPVDREPPAVLGGRVADAQYAQRRQPAQLSSGPKGGAQ